ncbi:MAG TPA: Fe-S protein assembly co-chaperone HscB [Ferruginibacter sp.]|nr:Fe-S protein assembly co-chaperone HscB [Ferruginibacter sp.]HRE65131.1 Fe-S protein assembly co-chaperone HscB [Ferruginibacter sp.]
MNYFELFGLEPAPVVDKSKLSVKYFELQKQNHPDFFLQDSEAEKEEALEVSANINKAFNIFRNEIKTLEYFLEYKGFIKDGEKFELPQDFLMEMMELNESFDEKDNESITAELSEINQQLSAEVKPILANTALYNDVPSLEKLKEWYYKQKYLQRILDRLSD